MHDTDDTNEKIFEGVSVAIQNCLNQTLDIKKSDRLVEDLQFDSLRLATLTFCIEGELNCSITLNEWVASVTESEQLTVGSLVDYVTQNMQLQETV